VFVLLLEISNCISRIALVGFCFEDDIELRSNSLLAFNTHTSAHLLDYQLANAESETSALRIGLSVFLEVAEVDKEIVYFVRRNPTAEVLDLDQKL
jgi:hypothetical protein